MKRIIEKTADGSTTIRIPEMEENYHSHHGAIQEAEHVFIHHGLDFIEKETIRIFELGFGTGLNALLTLKQAGHDAKRIDYVGLEAFPVEAELIDQLNYVDLIGEIYANDFQKMHQIDWDKKKAITDTFDLTKIHRKIQDYEGELNTFDLVYFDAFGPRAQGEMWELDVIEKVASLVKPGGALVSYCAQGQFKRHLKSLGFEVERLPGPPGKREMTRGVKA